MGQVTNHKLGLDGTREGAPWQCRAPGSPASSPACPPRGARKATASSEPDPQMGTWEKVSASGRKTAAFAKRCLGRRVRPLKVSFQVRFKEGSLAGGKTSRRSSSSRRRQTKRFGEERAQRPCEIRNLCSQLGAESNICPASPAGLLG